MKAQFAGTGKTTRVVITRSKEGNAELAEALKTIGLEPVSVDTIEFLPPEDWSQVDAFLTKLGEFDWLLFTSTTGVEFFVRRMKTMSLQLPWRGRPEAAAVGEKTGAALSREGIGVGFVPTEYLSSALAEQLPRGRGERVLLLRADMGDDQLVTTLKRRGFQVTDLTMYRTSAVEGDGEEAMGKAVAGADAIVFASPSAVEAFMRRFESAAKGQALNKRLLAVCIGPVTAKAARQRGFERVIAPKTHTIEGLVSELGRAAGLEEDK